MKNYSNAGLFMPTSSIWNVGYGPENMGFTKCQDLERN